MPEVCRVLGEANASSKDSESHFQLFAMVCSIGWDTFLRMSNLKFFRLWPE